MNELSDPSLRVLHRLADQMRDGFTGRIEIDLKDGGVAGYREVRTIRPSDMDAVPVTLDSMR